MIAFVIASLGIALMAIAGIGLLRMPDLLTRMHASSKAGTLGAILVLAAVAIHFSDAAIAVRAVVVCVFLLITAPIASHVIARAAYRTGVPLAPETVIDELADARSRRRDDNRDR
ncbi:MAG: monovalent cation/H(+) antiporter subunit G [Candidatus Sulfomarinibacteraceae bacterium]